MLGKELTHTNVCQVYKQEVCLEALHIILPPLLSDKVSIANMYGGGALLLRALVSSFLDFMYNFLLSLFS
jgi:hypothetical protein